MCPAIMHFHYHVAVSFVALKESARSSFDAGMPFNRNEYQAEGGDKIQFE